MKGMNDVKVVKGMAGVGGGTEGDVMMATCTIIDGHGLVRWRRVVGREWRAIALLTSALLMVCLNSSILVSMSGPFGSLGSD